MASLTRSKQYAATYAVGSYVQNANIGAFLVTVRGGSNAVQDLRNETGSREVIEMIVRNTNAIGYTITNSAAGTITLLVDNSQWDAAGLQATIRGIASISGDDSTSIAVEDSTVAAATTVTAA
jgi:hypothetical protein